MCLSHACADLVAVCSADTSHETAANVAHRITSPTSRFRLVGLFRSTSKTWHAPAEEKPLVLKKKQKMRDLA
jgi:hypothetical protein